MHSKFSHKAVVEVFHLFFLRQFHLQIDAQLYAIKGGCNLRFFFNSPRYSEDLDIDVRIIQKGTLQQKVQKILSAPGLLKTLQPYGVKRIEVNASKQTETTQRWKVHLHTESVSLPLVTKIEFSRRADNFLAELTNVSLGLCRDYRLSPMRCSHYPLKNALEQKVQALAHRTATQARDVFDLYHLLHMGQKPKLDLDEAALVLATKALQSISYQDYQAQVISFLPVDLQVQYGDPLYWDDMRQEVANFLEEEKSNETATSL